MILLIDVGNTNIHIGLADDLIYQTYRLNTEISKTHDEYYMSIKGLFDVSSVTAIVISSVVPRVTEVLKKVAIKYFNINPLIVTVGTKTGINIKTDNPKEVGSDLICAAAGLETSNPTVIVDLGTANKYIYVNNKTILGVIITAGIGISIKALIGNTALLPDIDIEVPKKVLGTNTIECMQSGVTYGIASEVEGLVERIKKEVKQDFLVVLTGGLSSLIAPLCNIKLERDSILVLKGLLKIYKKNI